MSKEIVFEERKLPQQVLFGEDFIQRAGKDIAENIDNIVFEILEARTGLPRELLMANTEEAILEHREKHPEKWIK